MSSILPKSTQPTVSQNGAPAQPFAVTSYRAIPADYGIYANALGLLNTPQSDYVRGALGGYRSLTSYSGEDWTLLDAVNQLQTARIKNGKSVSYGDGGIDMWRLLVEMNGDIAKVIAAQ